jgi:hypothetical protein
MLQRDPRPMVLYLRSFNDDRLELRTATAARSSLSERLSPRRFDRFEELLARALRDVGPVVAINQPGTTLAPLGAARETVEGGPWQQTVSEWLRGARLVVLAAPEAPTPGVAWEVKAIDDQQLWPSTLVVLPPLPDDVVRHRWDQLATLVAGTAMAGHGLPADPARVLLLLRNARGGWTAVTAARRDEWAYRAALAAALEEQAKAVSATAPVW